MSVSSEEWSMVSEAVFRLFDDVVGTAPEGHAVIGPQLEDLGWSDIETEDPVAAAALLFTAQGRALAQTEILDTAVQAELAAVLPEPVDAVLLPAATTGALCSADAAQISGVVLGPLRGPHGRIAAPVRTSSGRVSLRYLDTDRITSAIRSNTFDPTVYWTAITAPVPDGGDEATSQWELALAAAQRGLATELIAVADAALAAAVEHVSVRVQYGTAIGAMQSPRHALADASAHLEGARALLDGAWQYGGSLAAVTAKAAAGRAHRAVADVALQVCGAIGLTSEHRLHRFAARGLQLDALCGSVRQIEAQLASQLFESDNADQPLPTVLEWV